MRLFADIRDANIWRIYATIFVLGQSYGVTVALIAIFLEGRGYSATAIGSLGSWFAVGLVLSALPAGWLMRRFSAKRVLAFSVFGYAVAVCAFPFLDSYPAMAVVRALDGGFSVAVWISSETLLLARSEQRQKAFVTSLYALSLAVGYVVGPIVARGLAVVAPLSAAFVVSGVLSALAAIYVVLRVDPDPPGMSADGTEADGEPKASSLGSVLRRIKTSCFATFAYGYFQLSVVLLLPLYLMREKSISRDQTILIPAFFALGMLLFAGPVGRVADRVGHLLTMRVLALIGMVMVLGFVFLNSYALMCVAVFIAGASLATLSPVSIALQGVVCSGPDLSKATSVYNAFYGAGMLIGPTLSSALFDRYGGAIMLYHLAGLWLSFALFTLLFQRDDPKRAATRRLALGDA